MLCKNCQQEIGNKQECPHCGYNPVWDADGTRTKPATTFTKPQPIRVILKKMNNGKATAALVLSLFGFIPGIPGILSMIFAILGFFQAKKCRCGRGKAVVAVLINIIWVIIYILAFLAMGSAMENM